MSRKIYGASAGQAGASIVHIHARDPDTGLPTPDLQTTHAIVSAVRDRAPDIAINLSTAIAPELEPEKRIAPMQETLPEMATFNTSSMNFAVYNSKKKRVQTETVFENSFETMRMFAGRFREYNVKPEFEIYDTCGFRNVDVVADATGIDFGSRHYQFVFGVLGGMCHSPSSFAHLLSLLPAGSTWSVCGVGLVQSAVALCAAAYGGHIRVGLEDCLRNVNGQLSKGSYEQVTWAAEVAKASGRGVAEPQEARRLLGLDG